MKKFLIIQTAFIGDVILVTSLLEKLHQKFPHSEIHVLINKGNASLFDHHPFVKKIWLFDKTKKWKSLSSLILSLRKISFDEIINVHRFFSSGLISVLVKGKKRSGFDKNPLSFFYSKRYKHEISTNNTLHEIERNHQLILDITDDVVAKPRLYPSREDLISVPSKEKYVCMAPGSVWKTKQLSSEKWIEVIRKIPEDKSIYLLGSHKEKGLNDQLIKLSGRNNVFNKAGELSLLRSAAWMKSAEMNYVNDSAPLHLCSAMNAPVVVFFCSTVPAFGFGPLSDRHYISQVENLKCKPCGIHGYMECPEKHFNCSKIDLANVPI